ncbi:pregnancy-associated plasma protein-A [Dyadobacter jejuensis]|uniref:Pregnancy-associated plasma protein-A n=1 Tax=Dyadobacter jejuensis TaxID=1082580 RepID=A0A316AJB0_9BACT|nr:M43 family zinc metalloprotease [Dyadobacter jejuensis]PWJ57064.1 pregnancy-associated plasma protein-A [Dyadobacter jejuensis]
MPHISLTGKCHLLGSFLILSNLSASLAQERLYRHFNTQNVRLATIKKFPEYSENLIVLENSISNYASRGDNGQIIQVPVVFHFLQTASQKMPDETQVNFQLEVLNKYFGSYTAPETKDFPNPDVEKFISMGVSTGIQFYLGEIPGASGGINSLTVDRKNWGISNEIQDPKKNGGLPAADPTKTINIWIGELDGNNAGYALSPGAPAAIDGIVIDPDFFGNEKGTAKAPYSQGKTLVHLMGTYLGLYELWDEKEPCKDDLVEDTPLHDVPSSTVSTEKNTRYVCFCPGTPTAMYMNFMDNTDDASLSLFTEGQKKRMRAVLLSDNLRSGLLKK